MNRLAKVAVATGLTLLAIAPAPIIYESCRSHGLIGYYETGGIRCACGHTLFTYIDQSGFYDYVPGHGSDGTEQFGTLRSTADGWDVLRKRDGVAVLRLRISEGELYSLARRSTNWFREKRVTNPYRLWIPRVLAALRPW